jgi:hypothetical protein
MGQFNGSTVLKHTLSDEKTSTPPFPAINNFQKRGGIVNVIKSAVRKTKNYMNNERQI